MSAEAASIHELNTRICKLSLLLFDIWDGGGVRGVVVGDGGKKPKESGVKFDAEIPSQIPRRRAADVLANMRRQSQHNMIPLKNAQPTL